MAKWTVDDIADMKGSTVLITGANSGLGLESARALAGKRAHVIMACRNADKAQTAASELRESHPEASVEVMTLDLSSLSSVRAFSNVLHQRHTKLDLLMNNAGIMAIPYTTTADGFEMQFGTNHLGHFALTAQVFDLLLAAKAPRIVNVSSQAHLMGKLRWEDLNWAQSYSKWSAYGMSKLANLLFTYELARRAQSKGLPVTSVAAHPGYAATNLQYAGADMSGAAFMGKVTRMINPLLGQKAQMGALPQLYAACASDVSAGDYIGPDGLFSARGYPTKVKSNAASHDPDAQRRLWEVSETLTAQRFTQLA